jgi:hypothetical protein
MTKSFLSQNFSAVYNYGLLLNRNGITIVAGSQRLPYKNESTFAYLPFPGNDTNGQPLAADFEKINEPEVVAIITNVKFKTP